MKEMMLMSVGRYGFYPHVSTLFRFILGVLLIACMVSIQPVCAQSDTSKTPFLTAMGDSVINVVPDTAEVRIGIVTEAKTATEARNQNAERAQKVVQGMKALGIPDTAIQTSNFSINPVRRFPTNQPQQGEPPIVAYDVNNTISVRTEKFDLVPKIIDQSVASGANSVDGVNFTLKNDQDVRLRALGEASEEARRNAQAMASALGVKLLKLQSVQQGGSGVSPLSVMYRSMAAAEGAPTPIFPGQVSVSASVTVVYTIQ